MILEFKVKSFILLFIWALSQKIVTNDCFHCKKKT